MLKKQNKKQKSKIIIGKIGSPYGILGWISIFSFTQKKKNIFAYNFWKIKKEKKYFDITVIKWKRKKNKFYVKTKEIKDRTHASQFTNCNILIDEINLPILKNNEYYWKDIINCEVYNLNNYKIGYVISLIENGCYDILVIKTNLKKNKKMMFIPFIEKKIIKYVNINKKIIKIELPN
ncbi:Ribosome maturation factor RimM [Buchnera aphidicola (Neophyllaphis podocarpi)]|uniref:ribosome maturation factor RimM n=1 Tax=Buchnera aphidicola TaxID=9 RepID=UPI00346424F7